jgi:hypothetical protein
MIGEITTKQVQQDKYWDKNRVYTFDEYFKLAEKAPFRAEFLNRKLDPCQTKR